MPVTHIPTCRADAKRANRDTKGRRSLGAAMITAGLALLLSAHPVGAFDLDNLGKSLGESLEKRLGDEMDKAINPDAREPAPEPEVQRTPAPAPQAGNPDRRQAVTRDDVREIQASLNALGYDAGPVDGLMGSRTGAAIAAWQRDRGRPVTGAPSQRVLAGLRRETPSGQGRATAGGGRGPTAAPAVGHDQQRASSSPVASQGPVLDPQHRDYVHLVLKGNLDRAAAGPSAYGPEYFLATADQDRCKELRQLYYSGNEFNRRDFEADAAARFEGVLAGLDGSPDSFRVDMAAVYALGSYDFDRQTWPLQLRSRGDGPPLLEGGAHLISKAPCQISWGDRTFAQIYADFPAAPTVTALAISEEEAAAFRNAGNHSVQLAAQVEIRAGDGRRGPAPMLEARLLTLTARHPQTGAVLQRFDVSPSPAHAAASDELTAERAGNLLAPTVWRDRSDLHLERALKTYFNAHKRYLREGGVPDGLPLSSDEVRGRDPDYLTLAYRDRLREALTGTAVDLPTRVRLTQTFVPNYASRTSALQINGLIGHPDHVYEDWSTDRPAEGIDLSERGRPLYRFPNFIRQERGGGHRHLADYPFRAAMVMNTRVEPLVELDRFVKLPLFPITLDEADQRGLLGGIADKDRVTAEWVIDVQGVRDGALDREVVLESGFVSLTLRWLSDGALIREIGPGDLVTPAEVQETAAAARQTARLPDVTVSAPDPGLAFGAEAADLLQLAYRPDSVDDAMFERMMLSRFAYEKQALALDEKPVWGIFFPNHDAAPDAAYRAELLPSFRDWSRERAAKMPDRMTLRVRLNAIRVDVERRQQYGCREHQRAQRRPAGNGETVLTERVCDFLTAAAEIPETTIYLAAQPERYGVGLRGNCWYAAGPDREYCASVRTARQTLGVVDPGGIARPVFDLVQLDRVPDLNGLDLPSNPEAVVEIDVRPTGLETLSAWPETTWMRAIKAANAFALEHGISGLGVEPEARVAETIHRFIGQALAARVVDTRSGDVVRTLALGAPDELPMDKLTVAASQTAGFDVLGIRMGDSFADAAEKIRAHMQVGSLLKADRAGSLAAIKGKFEAYASGQLFVSESGREMIALYDEPPARSGRVMALWRMMRLPGHSVDVGALKAQLLDRYGEPSFIYDAQGFEREGVGFIWSDHPPSGRCQQRSRTRWDVTEWREADGERWTPDLPDVLGPPSLEAPYMTRAVEGNTPPAEARRHLCPARLGVEFLQWTRRSETVDSILVWLNDQQAYFDAFHESAQAPRSASGSSMGQPASEGPKIKF